MARETIAHVEWTCDRCGDVERAEGDAQPQGWIVGVGDLEVDGSVVALGGDFCGGECLAEQVRQAFG